MPTLHAETLNQIAQSIIEGVGTPADLAQIVGHSLVAANLVGHDSHGVLRLVSYINLAKQGQIQAEARPEIISRKQATACIDGHWGWGQPAGQLATETAIGIAAEAGVGAVTIRNCNHIGRLGEYVNRIAQQGLIGMALCNADPAVAPYGGYQRMLGTNPIAWAAPRMDGPPIVLDFATAAVAEGKLRIARASGAQVPYGTILDAAGKPTQNPADFYAGGALLPFGGHKGYGLSFMIELIGRGLAGMDYSSSADHRSANGTLIMAIAIDPFTPIDQFLTTAERLSRAIESAPPATGFSDIKLPGDVEQETYQRRSAEGIPVPTEIWVGLQELAKQFNLTLPE